MSMTVRGIRGAITVEKNSKEEIVSATKELLTEILKSNLFEIEEIAAIIFSATKDLDAEFPAVAARELGWNDTPLLCTNEIDVPGSQPRCLRVLLLVNTQLKQNEIKHVYLKEAVNLRR
jgi:chorismate mutase